MTYTWMANQLGHFTLGFLFTFLIVWIVELFAGSGYVAGHAWTWPCLLIPIGQTLFWSWKELRDYLIAVHDAEGNAFPVNRLDLVFNASTAVYFIFIGIVVAYASLVGGTAALVILLLFALSALPIGYYWLSRKLCFQRSTPPFLFRLADFKYAFAKGSEALPLQISEFALGQASFSHLLIFGPPASGRSSLAVAAITEFTFGARRARYLTWAKFLARAAPTPPEKLTQDGVRVWPWRDGDLVVIDDVVPDFQADTAPVARSALESKTSPDDWQAACRDLAKRRSIWVLGDTDAGSKTPDQWIDWLAAELHIDRKQFRFTVLELVDRKKPRIPVSALTAR